MWPASDSRVSLSGSFGSHVLKIDKTIATNTVRVFLKAFTRGLVSATQEIEWVICPKTGGVAVTKPSTSSVNIMNDPDSTTTLY